MGLRPLAYYVTAHGYGHGVRACDIIRALNRLYPEIPVTVVSDLPVSFFRNRLDSASNTFRPGSFDAGMVQLDSIRVDVPATLESALDLCRRWEDLLEGEGEFLRHSDAAGVVADIPAVPLEAASGCGLPGIAAGNFGFDWIYSEFVPRDSRWQAVVDRIARGYSKADLLLRLPFAEEMNAFAAVEDVPILASPGRQRRKELAAHTGAESDKPWVLISFTNLSWDAEALDRVEATGEYEFFTVLPLAWHRRNIHAVDREVIPFSDVLASVDGVVSKPGFGIISECIVNGRPLLFADRSDFREYAVLERAIRRYLKQTQIPAGELYAGRLEPWLDALRRSPDPPDRIDGGGAETASRRIAEVVYGKGRETITRR